MNTAGVYDRSCSRMPLHDITGVFVESDEDDTLIRPSSHHQTSPSSTQMLGWNDESDDYNLDVYHDDDSIDVYNDSDAENIPPTERPTITIPSIRVTSSSDSDIDIIPDSDGEHRSADDTAAPSAMSDGRMPWYAIFEGIYQGVWEGV